VLVPVLCAQCRVLSAGCSVPGAQCRVLSAGWVALGHSALSTQHPALSTEQPFVPTVRPFCVSTSCVTDAELVARARNGDHAAFGDLVDRHRTAVYRAALTALRSHAEAEDAAQDAFVLAWRRLDSFRGDASFKTWLLTIAWHQAINRRRGLMGRWRRMTSLDDGGTSPIGPRPDLTYAEAPGVSASAVASGFRRTITGSPEQLVADGELRRDIERGIRALSPKLRDTLLLAQSGEYSYEEIATMLKVPLGTIKWRVSEARRTVKKFLGGCGYDNV